MTKFVVYDCEILKAIYLDHEKRVEGIEYCEGFRDFTNMGVSVIGAVEINYNPLTPEANWRNLSYRIFTEETFPDFSVMVNDAVLVGFNNINFDDPLCLASGIDISGRIASYDILREIWRAAGHGATFNRDTHSGYGLDASCRANGIPGKTGHGASAPIDWQQGRYGKVIDYCLHDVWMTVELFRHIMMNNSILNPKFDETLPTSKDNPSTLEVRPPGYLL